MFILFQIKYRKKKVCCWFKFLVDGVKRLRYFYHLENEINLIHWNYMDEQIFKLNKFHYCNLICGGI